MQRIRNTIPNLLTLGNLACGLVAIVLLFQFEDLPPRTYPIIAGLMFAAMVFDFFDGFAARALKSTSLLGKELDSLADMVSFGVLPGMMVYQVIKLQFYLEDGLHPIPPGWHTTIIPASEVLLPFVGLLIPLFSAWRLAKFNIDTRQSYGFLGLPTPANALFFLSVFMIYMQNLVALDGLPRRYYSYGTLEETGMRLYSNDPFNLIYNPWVLAALTLIFSILLVTEIPLLAMKFKDYTWKGNWPRYVLILISVTLLAILWFRAIPLIIVLYFLFSFIDTRIHKKA